MTYSLIPLTHDPWQIFTLDLVIDGEVFHAQIEIRYMPAVGRWFVSIWDHSSSTLLVNQIPLCCSVNDLNDLLAPFRFVRNGKGLGSMFCIRSADENPASDPSENDLTEYKLLWGDTYGS